MQKLEIYLEAVKDLAGEKVKMVAVKCIKFAMDSFREDLIKIALSEIESSNSKLEEYRNSLCLGNLSEEESITQLKAISEKSRKGLIHRINNLFES